MNKIEVLVDSMPDFKGDVEEMSEADAMRLTIGSAVAYMAAFVGDDKWTPHDQMEYVWRMAAKYFNEIWLPDWRAVRVASTTDPFGK